MRAARCCTCCATTRRGSTVSARSISPKRDRARSFGSVAHFDRHLHVLMTDGAFGHDGTCVPLPVPEPAVLEESWRRAVLAAFMRRGWLEEDAAAGMPAWPHSGFGAYLGPPIEEREGYKVRGFRPRSWSNQKVTSPFVPSYTLRALTSPLVPRHPNLSSTLVASRRSSIPRTTTQFIHL